MADPLTDRAERRRRLAKLARRLRPETPSVDRYGMPKRRPFIDEAAPVADPGKRDRIMARFPIFAAQALAALERDKAKSRTVARQQYRVAAVSEREQWGDAADGADPTTDFGPGHQHTKSHGPAPHDLDARLVIEEVRERIGSDSSGRPKFGPAFRRARVADPVARLAAGGSLSERQHAAAEGLLDALEQASGGLGSPSEGLRIAAEPWQRTNLNEVQYQGIQAVRLCLAALSAPHLRCNLIPVVAWCIVMAGTLEGFATAYRMRRGNVAPMLCHALDITADTLGLPDNAVCRATQRARAEEVNLCHQG